MKYLKNVRMSPYSEDPGLNILTQEKFWNVTAPARQESIRALVTETAICLGRGELGTYFCWVGFMSMWEAMDTSNERALLEVHTRISLLPLISAFTLIVNQRHPFKSTFWYGQDH